MTMHENFDLKCGIMNEASSIFLHKRLRHISTERINILINNRVFETLDFINFGTYVNCFKEKQTNKAKKGSRRSFDIL